MADTLDRTTGLQAIVDRSTAGSWYLLLTFGDDRNTRVVPLGDGVEIVFGRSGDVVIDHEAVSRRHAVVRRRGDAVSIEDVGSRNGTLVNGNRITGSRRLTAGDVVAVGPATAIVARSSAPRTRPLATLGELEERLAIEVDRAHRYQRALAVVMLRLSGDGDAVLAHVEHLFAELRRMDLLAEYATDELAIVLPETDPAAAAIVAARAATAHGLEIRHGTATFPEDGNHPGALIAAAHERLRGVRPAAGAATEALPKLPTKAVVIDPLMKQVYKLAERAAKAPISVLVVGETGTGKEVVAETLHRLGPRHAAPYVRLNCAALTETLVESELFGHEKGSFTGATQTKRGIFETASGGTLFLDEIGELPLGTQAKLLRVLEQWRIVRVGGTTEIPVDVRLVCATNRDLEAEVRRGRFREDLMYRIAAFIIPIPPLRDRRTEILPLAVHFAHELAVELGHPAIGFTPEAADALQHASWPGNVRELRNVIERAVVLSGGTRIDRTHLPEELVEAARTRTAAGPLDVRQRVATVERETVLRALEECGDNQTQAAKQLGISRFALIRLMRKHEIRDGGTKRNLKSAGP